MRPSIMVGIAVLLMVLEAGLLSSNATVFFGSRTDQSLNFARQTSKAASTSADDRIIKDIEALLKRFEVDPARRERVAKAIVHSSRRHNIDPRLLASILIVESRGNPFAISSANAVGIMQIHVPTWARTVDREGINLFKIEDNVDFGARILSEYLTRYGEDEGIKRYNGCAPCEGEALNAQAYLQKVQNIYRSSSSD